MFLGRVYLHTSGSYGVSLCYFPLKSVNCPSVRDPLTGGCHPYTTSGSHVGLGAHPTGHHRIRPYWPLCKEITYPAAWGFHPYTTSRSHVGMAPRSVGVPSLHDFQKSRRHGTLAEHCADEPIWLSSNLQKRESFFVKNCRRRQLSTAIPYF